MNPEGSQGPARKLEPVEKKEKKKLPKFENVNICYVKRRRRPSA